jgi:hypothetical protein
MSARLSLSRVADYPRKAFNNAARMTSTGAVFPVHISKAIAP